MEKIKKFKINFIRAEMMLIGEFYCCLQLFIVCIKRIKSIFKDTDGVSLVGEVKLEIFKFNFLKLDSTDDSEF